MSKNNETLYIIQKIENLKIERNKHRELIERPRKSYTLGRIYFEEKSSSLELLDEFSKFLERYHFEKSKLTDLDQKSKELIDFILNDRIKKELTYKFIINLNKKYQLFFFPECPIELLYKNFIFHKTTLETIENDMIAYLKFIRNSEFKKSIELSPEIHCYMKINPEYDFINKLIEKFSYSEELRLYRIIFDYWEENIEYINNCQILIGKNALYLMSSGDASDINYMLFIKDYYKRIV